MSQISKPLKLPWMTYFPVKARSECVAPADDALGGVVEIMRMFHAACAASQRPGARPTRGSGVGGVIETIGITGGGIMAGGGGGGVGRAPPRAPGTCAGALSCGPTCGVVCGVVCGVCANAVPVSMPATSILEMSVAVLFMRDSIKSLNRSKHLVHDLDLDGLIGKDIGS